MAISPFEWVQILLSKAIVKNSSTECRSTDTPMQEISSTLVVITLPEGCSIFTPDLIIPALDTFQSKISISMWG